LSMVKLAVEKDFSGEIKFISEIGKGTTFIINFPQTDA
jgi:hypothetical protein